MAAAEVKTETAAEREADAAMELAAAEPGAEAKAKEEPAGAAMEVEASEPAPQAKKEPAPVHAVRAAAEAGTPGTAPAARQAEPGAAEAAGVKTESA